MGRAAAQIDIHAVGLKITEARIRLELAEQYLCCRGSRTVGAVHCNAQTAQVSLDGLRQMIGIFLNRINLTLDDTSELTIYCKRNLIRMVNVFLNACLQLVIQLIAIACKNFNSVVFIRIVRGRNNDTCRSTVLDGQICHSRSRDRTQNLNIHTGGADTGGQSRFQHIGRNSGILTD